jgi:hypothetical protein
MCEQADSRSFCQRQTNNSLRDRRHFVWRHSNIITS